MGKINVTTFSTYLREYTYRTNKTRKLENVG